MSDKIDCPRCDGTGKVPKPCELCHGRGYVQKTRSEDYGNGRGAFDLWQEPCPNGCPRPRVML